MGKRLSRTKTGFWLVAVALLVPLLPAGCADGTSASDKDKPAGFYTGLSSGAAHP